jgi:hypothetical protein
MSTREMYGSTRSSNDPTAVDVVDEVGGAVVEVNETLLEPGVAAGEPGGYEPVDGGVGGERLVPELLHRGQAGLVAQRNQWEILGLSYVCLVQSITGSSY